jgi:sugar lactone lactonase YvrE
VSTGIITTFAGTGASSYIGDNGPATSAGFFIPTGVALDDSGNIYVADTANSRIRKITVSTGIITTIAGTGGGDYSGDGGEATSAALYYPYDVELDVSGNVYIADYLNNRIRKVTISTGIISTIAGTGAHGYSDDNEAATSATLNYPAGIAVDSSGTHRIS